jgi:CDP-glycerol glycerophosphotransferase (TagB/SpsB family)
MVLALLKFDFRRIVRRFGTGRVLIGLRLLQLPVRLLFDLIAVFVPADDGLVLFGSTRDRFADNSAYAFLSFTSRQSRLRAVWVTGSADTVERLRKANLPVVRRWSRYGMWLTLRARLFVVSGYRSDINSLLGRRARLVNLWHGIPFKRIERDIASGPLALVHRPRRPWSLVRLLLRRDVAPPDFLGSPSSYVTHRCLTSAFGIDPARCWNVGYPRNDHLYSGSPSLPSEALVHDAALWSGLRRRFVVGYFPTWRDGGESVLDMGGMSLAALASVVHAMGGVLVFKPHFNDPTAKPATPDVIYLRPDEDLHAYLGLCDILITDYSSVALDFSITGRPVLYYTPDLEVYERQRGFYFAPQSVFLGPSSRTADELFAHLRAARAGVPPSARYLAVRDRFLGDFRGQAGPAVASLIASCLDRVVTPAGRASEVDRAMV